MNPLKVLMVNKFHYLKGGSETYHFAVGESLEAMGYDVAWFAMEDPRNLPCRQSRYFVGAADYAGGTSPLKKARDGLALIYSAEARGKFDALLEEFRPDVIHLNLVHRQLTFSILDAPYLKEHRVPVVYTAHDYIPVCPACTMLDGDGNVCDDCLSGSFSPCVRKRCVKGSRAKSALAVMEANSIRRRGAYRKIDRVIAPSEFMRSKLVEGGFPAERVVFMQNFAKDSVLASARDAEGRTDRENPYLLFFGRLSREKGIDVLIDAAAASLPSGWKLVVAGDGPDRRELEARAAASAVSDRIKFVGYKSGAELQALVAGAAFSVAPARWRENMPYSIVESLAYGTPVIGSRIGGIPELVAEGETGFACEAGDPGSLAEAISRAAMAFVDREAYAQMQSSCRDYVVTRCDQGAYMDRLIALYQGLIDTKKGAC